MGRKPVSALGIMGLVFSLMGIAFSISGASVWSLSGDSDARIVGPVHLLIGGVFLIMGVIFIVIVGVRRRKAKNLVENGRYIWGEIAALEADIKIQINHRHPYYAVVRCVTTYGNRTSFRTYSTMALRGREDLIGRKVKVYVADDTYRNYYVDISSLL